MTIPEQCKQCGRLAFPGEAVTISGAEYQELLQLRQIRDASNAKVSQLRLYSKTRIGRDPALAEFIINCSSTMLLREIEAACIERFGRERTPSQASISRFMRGR